MSRKNQGFRTPTHVIPAEDPSSPVRKKGIPVHMREGGAPLTTSAGSVTVLKNF
jgi:hypothetical protein